MEKWLWDQLILYIQTFSQGNLLLTLVLIAAVVAVTAIILAMIIRVIRALLPFLAIASFVALFWQMGLVTWCWQWLGSIR